MGAEYRTSFLTVKLYKKGKNKINAQQKSSQNYPGTAANKYHIHVHTGLRKINVFLDVDNTFMFVFIILYLYVRNSYESILNITCC